MKRKFGAIACLTAACLAVTGFGFGSWTRSYTASAAESIESSYDWGTLDISGGGFVSGIVTGQEAMYARTDVGGAYRYDYDTERWVQLLDFLNDSERGYLSVDGMCIDPTDDDTIYLLCGCAYFTDAKTVIFRSHDGGETFDTIDVTDLIQVHGNGYGRQFGESIAVDPDNPDVLYCGGDAASGSSGLIMSEDGGDTWTSVEGYSDLGFFSETINWPTWTEHQAKVNTDDEYTNQNGIGTIRITGGKIYIGTSALGTGNVAVADVGTDEFTVLSEDLPTDVYPSRINLDANGNLLITYVAGLAFGNGDGGIYRYNIDDNTVDNISPVENSFGACVSLDDPNMLIATTCAVWSQQSWGSDYDTETCYGEWLYRSTDGGQTWDSIYPGKMGSWVWDEETGNMSQLQLYDYLQDGGVSWIRNKAIHWSGSLVRDPRNETRFFVTSGNGVFEWDNLFPTADGTDDPVATFHATGIEEVVALDFTSATNGNNYSAIGDYDGFIHASDGSATQYLPNMSTLTGGSSSTGAIAVCPTDPNILVRCAESGSYAYYSTDAGATWTQLPGGLSAPVAAIVELEDGTYRIFNTATGHMSYTDDFGETWTEATINGDSLSSDIWVMQDPANPQYVYAYGYYYNQYYSYSKPSADLTDARYIFMVSDDYGATFTCQTVCQYDQNDNAYRIAYLEEGTVAIAAGWYGAYLVSDFGATVTKMDSVYYCKTMGYGAGENEGDPNAIYMYGQPESTDPEGIYRSTDEGATWVLINENHLYGGTGNGNFLVGDVNEFGTVYMSTVGCGIVVGKLGDGEEEPSVTTTTTEATTTTEGETTTTTEGETTTTTEGTDVTTESTTTGEANSDVLYGDVGLDGKVSLADAVLLGQYLSQISDLSDEALTNADVDLNGVHESADGVIILRFLAGAVPSLPYTETA